MRSVLVGAVEGSKVAFDALVDAGKPPTLVVTLPATAAERHSDFADISGPAAKIGSSVWHTTNINSADTIKAIADVAPDVIFVIGWSQICKAPFRNIARIGSVGFHPSSLPRLRGRGVIPWTILLGEKVTGSTLFWLDEGTDSGPILLQRIFAVADDETARSLYRKHMESIRTLLPEAAHLLETESAPRRPQDHLQASYCAKRTPEDGLIDWQQPASHILTLIRAVGSPYPGAYTYCATGKIQIDSATLFAEHERYIGLAGQVQFHTPSGFLVMCGNGICIEVNAWRSENGKPPAVHSKLHSPPYPPSYGFGQQDTSGTQKFR